MYIDLSTLNDGITQDKRRIKALMPGFIDVDERDIYALLKFMAELSTQFNYYNVNNNIEGTWEDFFKSDINVLVIIISQFDMAANINEYLEYEHEVYIAEEAVLYLALKKLFDFVLKILNILNDLRYRLINVSNGGKIVIELSRIVDSFDEEVYKLNQYNEEACIAFDDTLKIDKPNYFSNTAGFYQSEVKKIFSEGTSIQERIVNALPDIKAIFTNMSTKYTHMLGVTNYYLKNNDLLQQQYTPQLALCIAFLYLYSILQQKLNSITKKHLDLYYKQILGLESKKAIPDNVYIVFEKDAIASSVQLDAGEELFAQINGQQEPAIFTLSQPLLVNAVQIAELKTLYLAERGQLKNIVGTIKEVQVYNGNYDCDTASAFLKSKVPIKTWPVLGEDQDGLPDTEKTMDISSIGILIASPVLYQAEGRRAIRISIHLEDDSYENIVAYFNNYSKVTKKELIAVSHQLLSDAFIIDYTDTKGWKQIQKYAASLNMLSKTLDIDIQINNADEFIDVYNAETHGGDFDIKWPVFRLLLNNYAINNPFTFLRNVQMERITIRATVTGSRAVKLQNNIGPLSAVNSSQLFGPQPSVGSYLEIKNSNIFNKYTKDFCIRLDWLDLPKEPGGWGAYYSAYNNKIVNSSFRIKLSILTEGKSVPALPQQQELNLFQTDDNSILSSTTQLKNIDIKILGFNKIPLLDKEELIKDKNFSEGALRIELVEPQDAFGHRLFPQIFPEVVLYNARHSKKLPLPNQPYIPLIRSLSIDYVLEHSEALGGGNAKNPENGDLKVFHIHPFGFEDVYPGKKKYPTLIPDFDDENNLYIGLKGVKTGDELSLLFKLEENNFNNLLNPASISWSYLDDNTWINLKEKDVLLDATNNFINTGIIKIKLPDNLKTKNTILSPLLYWIRASTKGKTNVKSKIEGIYTQAAEAQRVNNNHEIALNIPPGCIKTFKRKIPGIQTITQPFTSTGGTNAENDEQYYIRVSERLRHGQKLITARDIEQAILERFPEILMAKCINPQQYSLTYIENYRPNTKVILIPRKQEKGLFLSMEPKVNLSIRYHVKKFLTRSISSFLTIDVDSPVYEKIKVICTVKFVEDPAIPNTGMCISKLNEDIKRFLCPWLYDERADFKIGTGIYIAEMLNYIKKLYYVKYVTGFSIVHFYFSESVNDGKKARIINYTDNNDAYIRGSLPETVLVPNKTHLINVEDDIKYVEAKKSGISEFAVMDELLVSMDESRDMEHEANQITNALDNRSFFDLVISHNLD